MPKFKVLLWFLFYFFCFLVSVSASTVKLKMIAANPSATEIKTLPVKTYLPKGINPQDISDKGKFEIGYDFDKSLYYAYQEVTLNPNESVTLELSMQDNWTVPIDEINSLKDHTQKIVSSLKNTELYNQAKILGESVVSRLDKITEIQASAQANTEQEISNYEASSAVLKEVKKDVGVLEDLAMESGGLTGIGSEGLIGEAASTVEPLNVQYTDLDINKLGTVKFKIELSNPSDKEADIPLKYYLPVEVKPEYIVDKGGLDVGYDYKRGVQYVYKDNVKLASKEKKEFTIEIKDIWTIPQQQISVLKAHTEKLMGILADSKYKEPAKYLAAKIISSLDNITSAQNNVNVSVESHIGDYRDNLKKFDEARKEISRLERLVIQSGGSVGFTVAEGQNSEAVNHKSERTVLRGAKGMELISKSIFHGKAPDITTSWKIIWVIIGFLAVVSFLFFILWWTQIKVSAGKKHEEVKQEEKK